MDYVHQYAGGHWSLSETRNDKAEPPGPAWLRNWLGDEYFVRPVGLSADLQPVGSSAEPPDDEDLVQIGVLTDLEFLSLDTAPGRGRIAGTGFAHLRNLRKLRYLMLGRQPITDEGLKLLEPLTELESLKLDEVRVTDAGLQYLQPLNKLASLSLEHTRVSDVGLQDLKSLKQLSTLDLIGTQVTDAGLAQLNGLSNLKQVFLVDTKVTEEGVRQLRQVLPKCDIFWRGRPRPISRPDLLVLWCHVTGPAVISLITSVQICSSSDCHISTIIARSSSAITRTVLSILFEPTAPEIAPPSFGGCPNPFALPSFRETGSSSTGHRGQFNASQLLITAKIDLCVAFGSIGHV